MSAPKHVRGTRCFVEARNERKWTNTRLYTSSGPRASPESEMDLIKMRSIESLFAGSGEVHALDWPAAVLGASLAARRCKAGAPLMRIEPPKETDR